MRKIIAEAYRLRLLRGLEEELGGLGLARVAGVDEAGRGCLAGPVVAAAVVPDALRLVPGVDDSKHLAPERREELAVAIRRHALAWSVVAVSAAAIDRSDILTATRSAMRRALASLEPAPDCAVVDAVRLDGLPYPCLPLVRGDQVCYAVAAASILAKTARDAMMRELDRRFPHYGFARHKGYAAPQHLSALAEHGPCPSHRLSFGRVLPRA